MNPVNSTPPHPDNYTYRTAWSHEEQNFISTVAEFPDLRWPAKTPEAAEAGLKAVVYETLMDLYRSGGVAPQPQPRAIPWQQPAPAPTYHPTFPIPQSHLQMPQYAAGSAQGVNQSVNVVVGGGGYRPFYRRSGIGVGWHIFHGIMTLLTCVWGFVWIGHIVADSNRKPR